jgi:hypothetical protein
MGHSRHNSIRGTQGEQKLSSHWSSVKACTLLGVNSGRGFQKRGGQHRICQQWARDTEERSEVRAQGAKAICSRAGKESWGGSGFWGAKAMLYGPWNILHISSYRQSLLFSMWGRGLQIGGSSSRDLVKMQKDWFKTTEQFCKWSKCHLLYSAEVYILLYYKSIWIRQVTQSSPYTSCQSFFTRLLIRATSQESKADQRLLWPMSRSEFTLSEVHFTLAHPDLTGWGIPSIRAGGATTQPQALGSCFIFEVQIFFFFLLNFYKADIIVAKWEWSKCLKSTHVDSNPSFAMLKVVDM